MHRSLDRERIGLLKSLRSFFRLENVQSLTETAANRDKVVVVQEEFAGDLADFLVFPGGNATLRRGDGVKTLQNVEFLLSVDQPIQFSGYEKVVDLPEKPMLLAGHFHHQGRLLGRKVAQLLDQLFHFGRFFRGDFQVGSSHTAQEVGESGEKSSLVLG